MYYIQYVNICIKIKLKPFVHKLNSIAHKAKVTCINKSNWSHFLHQIEDGCKSNEHTIIPKLRSSACLKMGSVWWPFSTVSCFPVVLIYFFCDLFYLWFILFFLCFLLVFYFIFLYLIVVYVILMCYCNICYFNVNCNVLL